MATKQELEAKVAELEAQLAASAPQEPPEVDAAVQDLKASLAEVAAENQTLKDQLAGRTAREASLAAERDSLRAELNDLTSKLKDVSKKGEGVVLGGVPHVIIRQERAADLVEAFRKRYIEDDETVLVVKKA